MVFNVIVESGAINTITLIFVSAIIRCFHAMNKGNNKITELRTIFQREKKTSQVYKQTKSVNKRKTGKTVMTLTWYRHF